MSQYEWNVAGLLELANFATRLESRKLRADIYLRIARSDNKVARQWIDEAARAVLGDSEYETAAEIYFTAQDRAQSNQFQITSGGGAVTLAPGATRNVTLTFAPTAVGTRAAELRVTSNDTNTPVMNIALTGLGIDPNAPDPAARRTGRRRWAR